MNISPRFNSFASYRSVLLIMGVFIIAAAAVAVPVYSVRSSSSPNEPARENKSSVTSRKQSKFDSLRAFSSGAPSSLRSNVLPVPQPSPETIATFAADCTTPKTLFFLGETVCAKTDLVELAQNPNDPAPWWVNWISLDPINIVYGGDHELNVTTNPQTFLYTPTEAGIYKVSLSNVPGDASQTPAGFTVVSQTAALLTYAPDCTTLKANFNLGETICARVVGAPDTFSRITFANPNNFILGQFNITSPTQTFSFSLPNTGSATFNGEATDNRGTWTVNIIDTRDAGLNEAIPITVRKSNLLADRVADLQLSKSLFGIPIPDPETHNTLLTFELVITNQGPDVAVNPHLTDFTLPNTTFISFNQHAGPVARNAFADTDFLAFLPHSTFNSLSDNGPLGSPFLRFIRSPGSNSPPSPTLTFNCTPPAVGSAGSTTCTYTGELAVGETARFTAVYQVSGSVASNAVLSDDNSASVGSDTSDQFASSNNSAVSITSPATSTSSCTLTCPGNITVAANSVNASGQAGAIVTFAGAESSGSCGTGPITSSPTSGSFFAVGSSVVTTTTPSGTSCSFLVTVNDNAVPTITCPSNISVNEDSGGAGTTVSYTGLSATDNSGTATISCTEGSDSRPSGSHFDAGTHTITCIARDSDNNESPSCSFDVVVNAAPACGLTPPANISVNSPANACGVNVDYDIPTANANCTTGTTISCNHASGSFFPVGDTLVTCTSNPDAATTSFTVSVNDTTGPVPDQATLPTLTGECSVTAGIPVTVIVRDQFGNPVVPAQTQTVSEAPTATDSCSGKVAATTTQPRTYDVPGNYVVTWTYTDGKGNTATQDQTVIVTGPVGSLDISGPAAVSVHNGLGSTSCSMVIDDLTSVLNTHVSGSCGDNDLVRTITPSAPDNVFNVGVTYTIVSTVTEGSATDSVTQTFRVIDDTPPVITSIPANATYQCASQVPAGSPSQATATDNCGTPTITVSDANNGGAGSTANPRVITRTYTATDESGRTASSSQTITIIDNTAPTLNAPDIVVSNDPGSCSAVVNFTGLNASDNCGTANINTTIASGSSFGKGTTTVTATATDAVGNQTTKNFTVTVNDTEAPTINYPAAGVTAYLPLNSTATSTAVSYTVTAADNCAGVVLGVSPISGSTFPVGTSVVTATATDASGNITTRQFNVTVLYNFTGFFSPVSNSPTLNSVNAGRAIPVKFSLSGNKGLDIFAAGSPSTVSLNCSTSDPGVEVVETLTAGGSSLSFGGDQYNYVWKTESSWVNTCRQLRITLNDGSVHVANFKFK